MDGRINRRQSERGAGVRETGERGNEGKKKRKGMRTRRRKWKWDGQEEEEEEEEK